VGFCSCIQNYSFFLVSWGGVRLSPLGTSATSWPIVPAPDDRWWWMWSNRWNENWQGEPKYSEKTCPSATLSTTNPTWPGLDPGPRDGKSATNRLSYGMAFHNYSIFPIAYSINPSLRRYWSSVLFARSKGFIMS
jgi:hypothetical protein